MSSFESAEHMLGRPSGRVDFAPSATISGEQSTKIPLWRRLRVRLVVLICLSVFFTEILVFVPTLANVERRWFENRHQSLHALALVLADDHTAFERGLYRPILSASEALGLRVISPPEGTILEMRRDQGDLIIDEIIDVARFSNIQLALHALETLFSQDGQRILQLDGSIENSGVELSVIMTDRSLHQALVVYAKRFSAISLTIALIAASLIYLIVSLVLVRPIQKIYYNILDFVADPANPSRIMIPEARHDEVGFAQRRIATIETALQQNYIRRKRLADLGLAVSKINHDMRNMLASAQLISDRLSEVDDPMVRRLAPKLMRTLDRAINYSQSVITHGRVQETAPQIKPLPLHQLIEDVFGMLGAHGANEVELCNHVTTDFEIKADAEQLHRVIMNLCRNAIEAMTTQKNLDNARPKQIIIEAHHEGENSVIAIKDTGPGFPASARAHLFEPFQGSMSKNGTGLGLAICDELIRAQNGTICLMDSEIWPGTYFEIRL